MFEDTYKNKHVLVTGHTGFKGSWLCIWLKMLGAKVIGYSLEPPSKPSNFEACALIKKIEHTHGDVRDYKNLLLVCKRYKPEFVFHLAAQPLVRVSYVKPRLTYDTNVMGTVNVLEAVRETDSVRVVINVTSDKCYENREWLWGYRENEAMGGRDPYSSSKGCAELVTTAYLKSFFPPETYGQVHLIALASVRAGNVIGGGDWGVDRLIPDCVRHLSQQEEIAVRYPKAIRPWQHVLESLSGYLTLGAKLWTDGAHYSGAWNFGPMDGEIWSVEEVVRETIRLWGRGDYKVDSKEKPYEAHWLKLDSSKARIRLDWRPRYKVREALEKTINWYKKFYDKAATNKMWEYTVGQINEYAALME